MGRLEYFDTAISLTGAGRDAAAARIQAAKSRKAGLKISTSPSPKRVVKPSEPLRGLPIEEMSTRRKPGERKQTKRWSRGRERPGKA